MNGPRQIFGPVGISTVFITLLFASFANAGKPSSSPPEPVPWDCTDCLVVETSTSGNTLTWPEFTGFAVFGYDIHYSGNEPLTADNNTRIETGAVNGQYLDSLAGWQDRCLAERYWIQGYSRGRKSYTSFVQGTAGQMAPECSGGGGGEGGGGGNTQSLAVLPGGTVDTTVIDSASAWRTSSVPAGYQLVAWEEFSGDDLSTLGQEGGIPFYSRQPWGPDVITNGEKQYYLDVLGGASTTDTDSNPWSPFQLLKNDDGDGLLAIRAARLNAAKTDTNSAVPLEYLSGVLTTHPGSTQSGKGAYSPPFYFETRARMPRGRAVYPAIWFLDYNLGGGNEELDIIEYIGQSCLEEAVDGTCTSWTPSEYGNSTWETQYHAYHDASGGRYQSWTNSGNEAGMSDDWGGQVVDFSHEFRTYGLWYGTNEVIWYIDGIAVMKVIKGRGRSKRKDVFYTNRFPSSPMYLALNVAIDQSWLKLGADSSTDAHLNNNGINDVSMLIDYVRFYKP